MKTKRNQSEIEKWERIWTRYIEALKALDKPIKGTNARCAQARLAKAEKAIRDYDKRR